MKDYYTVKEVMDGTGLTRQGIHALLKRRGIQVHKEKNKFLIKWEDLADMYGNPAMFAFLRSDLEKERNRLEGSYQKLRENAKGMMYAYVLIMEKEFPTPEGTDFNWMRLFRKAYTYWWQMSEWYGCHWVLEADKYDYLDADDKEARDTTMTEKAP
jgi:hypothetical protein